VIYTTAEAKSVRDSLFTLAAPLNIKTYRVGALISFDDNWDLSNKQNPNCYLSYSSVQNQQSIFLKIGSYGSTNNPGSLVPIVNCTITSPPDGSVIYPGDIIDITVNASYPQGSVSEVDLFVNGQSVGTSTYPLPGNQFSFQWNSIGKTTLQYYNFQVTAKNNLGQMGYDNARVFLGQNSVYGPSCDIFSIQPYVTDSIAVYVSAYANNNGETILSVDYYLDGAKKTTVTKGNFGTYKAYLGIKNLSVGYHEIKALAQDSKNRTASSIQNYNIQ
jgi:hypothetical protein